jgi:hypothetical protein
MKNDQSVSWEVAKENFKSNIPQSLLYDMNGVIKALLIAAKNMEGSLLELMASEDKKSLTISRENIMLSSLVIRAWDELLANAKQPEMELFFNSAIQNKAKGKPKIN